MATCLTPTVKIMADSCVSWLVDLALSRLAKIDPRIAQVVELRYFGGLSNEEIAAVLQVSAITVIRSWNFARVWLLGTLGEGRRRSLPEFRRVSTTTHSSPVRQQTALCHVPA